MSVSRRAGPPQAGTGGHPVLGRRQRALALRGVVLDLGKQHRQLVVGDGNDPAALAVDDGDRAAPVALAGEQPVAQPVVDRGLAAALARQPLDDRPRRLGGCIPVNSPELTSRSPSECSTKAGPRGALAVGAASTTRRISQLERAGELVVALVVRGHGHDRPGPVLHQHVVGDEHRDLLAVDRVGDRAARAARRSSRAPRRRAPRPTRAIARLTYSRTALLVRRCRRRGAARRDARGRARRRWRRTACRGGS